jgi:hypothetical protein
MEITMSNEIDEVIQRTYRYFYEDGLVELTIGGLFLAIGILLQLWARVAIGSPFVLVLSLSLVLLVIGGGLIIKRLIGSIKERVTYPRTGYVSYHQRQPSKGRWLIIAVALVLVVLSGILPEWFSRMAVFEGLLLLVVLGFLGYRIGVRRFYLVGIIAAILGLCAALLIPEDLFGSSVTFGGTGIALLLSGALALRAFLQEHPEVRENVS